MLGSILRKGKRRMVQLKTLRPRQGAAQNVETVPVSPREKLRLRIAKARGSLEFLAADRTNHTYALVGKVRRHRFAEDAGDETQE